MRDNLLIKLLISGKHFQLFYYTPDKAKGIEFSRLSDKNISTLNYVFVYRRFFMKSFI